MTRQSKDFQNLALSIGSYSKSVTLPLAEIFGYLTCSLVIKPCLIVSHFFFNRINEVDIKLCRKRDTVNENIRKLLFNTRQKFLVGTDLLRWEVIVP